MSYAASRSSGPRLIGLGIVVLLHVGVLYALQSGLAKSMVEVIRGPIETKIIEETPQPKEETPPPPPPDFEQPPPPFVPPPEVAINLSPEPAPTAITNVQAEVKTPPPPPQITPPQSTHRNSQPDYPPTSRRLGEEGTVVLLLYVLENGRVGEVRIDKSSGFQRLDDAASREARRNWRFKPALQGDRPVAAWTRIAVTFRLTDG